MAREEFVEQRLALDRVDVLALAGPVDVLEQRELVDPHLQAPGRHEVAETLHEQAQHLVHIDQHEGPIRRQAQGIEARCGGG